ncbi:hypothetical protein D187_008178 [Cystobacter fuscus DSM 2262]|uniref:Uncharacterized protein n=2 Tax=Cystobacter fuscus TaxID=43 RepID=S9QHK7_CYSF2|nr:hypothetical protein D187_008178 [Cystobacter fuscus DSM 2262]
MGAFMVRLMLMRGFPHHIARWLRLALACFSVLGASLPAHAHPASEAAVAVWVERHESARQRPAVDASVHLEHPDEGSPRAPARVALPGSLRESRTAAPPRRLFLFHRALLH